MLAASAGVPATADHQEGAANRLASAGTQGSPDAPTGSSEGPADEAIGSLHAAPGGNDSDDRNGQAGQGCVQAAQAAGPGHPGAKHAVKAGPISKQDLERALQLVTSAAGLWYSRI